MNHLYRIYRSILAQLLLLLAHYFILDFFNFRNQEIRPVSLSDSELIH